jgi:transcriptional regulator with XRE-family HTH domain
MIDDWPKKLRTARQDLGLPQAKLARLAGVSPDTVRACESGRRRPSRNVLEALLVALKLDRWEANQIRHELGYAADYIQLGKVDPSFMFRIAELSEWIERTPWPQFIVDENMQIVLANSSAQKFWQIDAYREYPTPRDRGMIKFATDVRFGGRVLNWDEMVGYAISIWKGHHLGPESIDQPSPYFDVALKELAAGDPKLVSRFIDLWQRTEGKTPKVRDRYPVVWQAPGRPTARFLALSSTANEWEGLAFHDWIPVDAQTWAVLDAMKAERPPNG